MKIKDAEKKMCPFSITTDMSKGLSDCFFPKLRRMGIELGEGGNVYLRTVCITTDCMAWIETGKDEGTCGMIQQREKEGEHDC